MRSAAWPSVLLIIAQTCIAQGATRPRSPREVAESMVTSSGPLRNPARADYTPQTWRPRRALAGTWADPQARHRFTRHTHGWAVWYGCGWYRWYGRAPYWSWHSWRGCW